MKKESTQTSWDRLLTPLPPTHPPATLVFHTVLRGCHWPRTHCEVPHHKRGRGHLMLLNSKLGKACSGGGKEEPGRKHPWLPSNFLCCTKPSCKETTEAWEFLHIGSGAAWDSRALRKKLRRRFWPRAPRVVLYRPRTPRLLRTPRVLLALLLEGGRRSPALTMAAARGSTALRLASPESAAGESGGGDKPVRGAC